MKYKNVEGAVFIDRPNRFIANVELNGKTETVHVKNTGRCRELLVKGCDVWLERSDNPARKTAYDLIAVKKCPDGRAPMLINMDSQLPNKIAEEWLPVSGIFPEGSEIRREVTHGDSRFDIMVTAPDGKIIFVEVKGVTLEREGIAFFPDAPTVRGVKHINGLIRCLSEGYGACILFVVQMKGISEVQPNYEAHREFGAALAEAERAGVKCIAVDCIVTPDEVRADSIIPVVIKEERTP